MLPIAAELAVKIQGLFYLCKGETSQQQGSESWAVDVQVPVLPASNVRSSPTRVSSGIQRHTTLCLERSS